VPGYTNPQSLNRYSYVVNNPLRYTDPTGHRCVEGGFEGSCGSVEVKQTKKYKDDLETKRRENKFRAELKGLGSSGPACSGSNQSVVCLPASDSGANTPIDLQLPYRQSHSQGFSFDVDGYVNGLETEWMAFDFVLAMQSAADYTKPAYRQLKAAVPLTALEMSISGSLQTIQDLDNDLNLGQRAARSITVSLETGLTDVVADVYGAAGYVQAGGIGYVAAAVAASVTMDNNWDILNAKAFPILNMGTYP
jgi:hypothetical protein